MQLDVDIRKTLRSGARVFQLQARFQAQGQRVVVMGPSGAGKSLLLKAIAGLLRPDSGHVRIDGQTLFDAQAGIHQPPQARRLAYLFQDYALFPHLSVRQNIAFGLARGGWPPGRAQQDSAAVNYWLDALQLREVAHQAPHELSGGQRQRTALARALVAQPRALLLDEPFAALDPALRVSLRAELDALQRRLQVPLVLITHDPQDLELFGEQVLRMEAGRL
ncbi:MAG: ATP-binding cassette domain-containing protein [Burkholderiaceae bacterium]|nr:ATP-binding cassette domain-containing protein [Burkholderiaceae bacterium]